MQAGGVQPAWALLLVAIPVISLYSHGWCARAPCGAIPGHARRFERACLLAGQDTCKQVGSRRICKIRLLLTQTRCSPIERLPAQLQVEARPCHAKAVAVSAVRENAAKQRSAMLLLLDAARFAVKLPVVCSSA